MSDNESEPVVVSAAAVTDTGRVRNNNEDFVAYRVPEPATREAAFGSLFIVCDGVGGGVSGEVASEQAGQCILNAYYNSHVDQPPPARLLDAIRRANLEVYQIEPRATGRPPDDHDSGLRGGAGVALVPGAHR